MSGNAARFNSPSFICLAILTVGLLAIGLLATHLMASETDAELLRGAAERIEKYRKADALVSLVDESGNPVPGAQLSIELTRHEFLFGCNFFQFGKLNTPEEEQAYRTQFAELFNYATLPFFWALYDEQQGRPNHAAMEDKARWCRDHGIATKGHPLAWNFLDRPGLPDSSEEINRMQQAWITDCISRFRGLIDTWVVVNEAADFERKEFWDSSPKMTRMWMKQGRIEFVDQCFQTAREAGPAATLLINDLRTGSKYWNVLEQMAQPDGKLVFDAIGIQSHMHASIWSNRKLWDTCQGLSRFEKPIHFTELTVLSGQLGWERPQPWRSTAEGEQRQAEEVRRIYTLLFSHPSVTAITWWDLIDRDAWQGAPAGLVDKDLQPKPAYHVLKDLIQNQWRTKINQPTNQQGQVAFRGYLGEYRVRATLENGEIIEREWTLASGEKNVLRIVVE